MGDSQQGFTRRRWLKTLGAAGATLAAGRILGKPDAAAQEPSGQQPAPEFTGPGANPYWTSPGQFATYPQKAPLILLTDRPVQLETPRHYFLSTVHSQRCIFCPLASSDHSQRGGFERVAPACGRKCRSPAGAQFSGIDDSIQERFDCRGESMLRQQPQPAAAASRGRAVGKRRDGQRRVDRRETPRHSRCRRREERLGASAI